MTITEETRLQAGRAFHCVSLVLTTVPASQLAGYQKVAAVSADLILPRLTGLRQTRPYQWIARCPAHEDRRASLSVRELPDGQVLIHCFAGCGTDEVMAAVGLTLANLFPERVRVLERKPERRRFDPISVLHAIAHEAAVVALLAEDIREGRQVDGKRLLVAAQRIHRALDAVGELRLPEELRGIRRGEVS